MGVCGLVLVSLGQKLNFLALNVGLTPQEIGTVFVLRGVGAVAGSLLSAALYHEFPGNRIIALALLVIFFILLLLPHNTSYIILHVYFFLLGFSTAITDTGCQIMTRKLHGEFAGPWLGANTVAFGLTGAVVPLVVLFAEDVEEQFALLASVVFLICALTVLSPSLPTSSSISNGMQNGHGRKDRNKSHSSSDNSSRNSDIREGGESEGNSPQFERKLAYLTRQNSEGYHHHHADSSTSSSNNNSPTPTITMSPSLLSVSTLGTMSASSDNNEVQPLRPRNNKGATHYYVEVVIGIMVFFIIGGQVTLTAYLSAYVEQMQVFKESESRDSDLMLCFWLLMTLGRLLVIQDLRFVTNQSLPWHLAIFSLFGIAASGVLLLFPINVLCLWIAVPAYGFFNGPLLGYSYDLNNRLTDQSELSTSIIMMFLNLGASVVPFCSSLLWKEMGPRTLFLILFISMVVQPFLLVLALSFSYRKPQKRVRFDGGYSSLEDATTHQ